MSRQKIVSLGVCLLLAAFAWPAQASENTTVHVMAPFARAVPEVMKNAAAYMVLRNNSKTPMVLTGVKGDVAEHIELHQSLMADGMMKMQPVETLTLPPGGIVEFKPGSYHVMLIGLKRQLKEGDSFQLILIFADGSERHVQVPVQGMGARPMPMHQHQEHQPMHKHHKQQMPSG